MSLEGTPNPFPRSHTRWTYAQGVVMLGIGRYTRVMIAICRSIASFFRLLQVGVPPARGRQVRLGVG